ncbi:MAG TPA: DUF3298 and DUF4163 domain-containing protein [Thermoanaerobaculia bacterium]|nr:DUF3298 and DUF4163 domain-containing protein [Thermoanaerobaculia bacterium]
MPSSLRKKSVHFVLSPAVLILAFACGGSPEAEPPVAGAPPAPAQAAAPRPPGISWQTRTLERTAAGCGEEGQCAAVSLEYPEVTAAPGEGTVQVLNRFIRDFVLAPAVGEEASATPEALAEEVLQEAERFHRELPDAPGGWSLERTVKIVHQTPRVVSLEATESVFLGGAHPNSTVIYASFDPTTGRRISLADLFLPTVGQRLREVAERRFRETRGIPPDRSLAEEGFEFEGGSFDLNDNFALLEDGLVFYYNAYEIAAYVMGPTEVKLTREDLAGLVRPDGPLGG